MSQYQKWPEEKYPKKCPVHNCYIFRPINSQNYQPNIPTYIVKPNQQIYQSKNYTNNQASNQYNTYTQNNQLDPSLLLKQYASSDGVLRGYNNNYSFYESGSSQIKSKVTINNQINNFTTQTFGQYPYQARQINTTNNHSYIILEKEPIVYNYNTNYNNSNIGGFKYNEIQNQNINNNQQRIYQAPKIEKRTVKRVVDKEPYSQKITRYNQIQRNNYRSINTNTQNPTYQKINMNNNYGKYSGTQTTNYSTRAISNKRSISPITSNYSRPIISQRQKLLQNRPNNNNNISYDSRANQYRVYTETNDYQSYNNNYPSNNYQKNNISNISNKQREYTSRTEFPEQRGYKYEYEQEDYKNDEDNDDEEDIYEVPVQNNKINYNNYVKKEIYSERPFTRITQMQKNGGGKRYGVYTQTLAMNNNYYNNNEYEYEINSGNNRINNNNYYSQPKYRQPYQYAGGKRYTTQENNFTSFQKSLRNIRLNNEEIEMENDARNSHRVKIRTSGADNHGLYISNSHQRFPRKSYRTYTEQNAYRNQDYVLQELEDEDYEYADKNRFNNNLRLIKNNKMEQNYQNEEEVENDEDSDEEKMYDNNKLIKAQNDNFKIMRQNVNLNGANDDKKEIEEDEDYIINEDEMPHDSRHPKNEKKVKNIETEINEKYYDNQGNYLGEKKIITTKQVPVDQKNINIQKEGLGEEEQEEIEEYESENYNEDNNNNNNNNNEYIPYKSNNKKFQKRGESTNNTKSTNYNNINERPSKYHSYFGDSSNNVYYESKANSKEINTDEKKYNLNTKLNNQNIQIRNTNYGIQSENLCVPAEENKDENEENEEEEDNDEKEADEQHIEENEFLFDNEDENNNKKIENNDNDKKPDEENVETKKENSGTNMEDNEINEDKERDEENNLENINEEENNEDEKNEKNNPINDGKNITINKNVEIEIQNLNNDNINNNIDEVNINNKNNQINNQNERNFEENNGEENEEQNIQNEEQGGEEYVGEEEYPGDEEMVDVEYEFEGNNEQDYEEEMENNEEGEENENYENYDVDRENIEYNENDENIKKED